MSNVVRIRDTLISELDHAKDETLKSGGGDGIDPPGGKSDSLPMKERLSKIEGQLEGLRVVRPMTITVMAVLLAALVFVIGNITLQVQATNSKVDAIPGKLNEEFRAMRTDMAAQTSAIANSITAARGTPAQVLLVPAPQPIAQPERSPER